MIVCCYVTCILELYILFYFENMWIELEVFGDL